MKTQYICFEGLDGSGKSTIAKALKDKLELEGKTVLLVSEPGYHGDEISMQLRSMALNPNFKLNKLTRELILQAARSQTYNEIILPAMGKYDYILQDRGALSSLSYGVASNVDRKFLEFNLRSIFKKTLKMSILKFSSLKVLYMSQLKELKKLIQSLLEEII